MPKKAASKKRERDPAGTLQARKFNRVPSNVDVSDLLSAPAARS